MCGYAVIVVHLRHLCNLFVKALDQIGGLLYKRTHFYAFGPVRSFRS